MSEAHRGAFGVVDAAAPLSREDVEKLPDGEKVTVIWSGGNGPAEYVIAVHEASGHRYVWDGENTLLRYYNALSFIGDERFHTRVWLGHGLIRSA